MDPPEKILCQAHGQARPIADFLHENGTLLSPKKRTLAEANVLVVLHLNKIAFLFYFVTHFLQFLTS